MIKKTIGLSEESFTMLVSVLINEIISMEKLSTDLNSEYLRSVIKCLDEIKQSNKTDN